MDRRFHSRLMQGYNNMPIHKNIISVQCSNCDGWCHMRRCSGLVNHKARTANFIVPCSSQAAQTCQNDNTSPPSTLGATSVTPTAIYDVRVPPTTVSVNISEPTSNISTLSTIRSSPFITTPVITSNLSSIKAHVDCSATPTNIDSTSLSFNIMQLNCNGLRDKLQEILRFMQMNNVLVAALQETKFSELCSLTAPGFIIGSKEYPCLPYT